MSRFGAGLLALAVLLALGCNGDTTGRDDALVEVSGTWDGLFSGTVQGSGTSQTDSFVMDLRQTESSVTGTVLYQGTDVVLPLAGSVTGREFAYTATATIGGSCQVRVEARTTVDASGTRFSGSQTQSTCEGTAVGQMSATKR